MILGIDEAGRGPWAGPLVVGAVVLGGVQIEGLTDSKKLSKKKRELLYEVIKKEAPAYSSGWVTAAELDDIGMSEALKLGTRRAVEKISVPYSEIIIDGTVNFLNDTGKGRYVQTMAKADLLVPSVSAASVVAKVERDRYMTALSEIYPGYGFHEHAGYGVAKHSSAIDELGVTPEHRLSFAPLQKYKQHEDAAVVHTQKVTSKRIGDTAEAVAAEYLAMHGHTILERNWRTKLCEIDIVSKKGDTFYFVEVKHRKSDKSGNGLAMITSKKLRQMGFAAKLYAHNKRLYETNLKLAAVATTGEPPIVTDYIEIA